MQYMNRLTGSSLLVAALMLSSAAASAAPDPALLEKCTICHGETGISIESAYPTIAGLPVRLQRDALKAYRDGTRDCGPVQRMCKITREVTDAQLDELAAHFAAFPFKPAVQAFDQKLIERGGQLHEDFCQVCHGDSPADAEKSILHGQWSDYLRYSLKQYRLGHRKQPPSMRRQTDKLTDQDIDALVSFYASYK